MRTIGITGGVGAGKSAILAYIKEHYNCRMILADEAAHKLEQPGEVCYEKLVQLLGDEILSQDGTICKQRMAAKIFADHTLLQKVNHIVHPAVRIYIIRELEKEKASQSHDFFFLEAALLIEEHYEEILDELWYIYTREEIRAQRLRESRGYSSEKIEQIMKKQLPEETFRGFCKVVIDNSGQIEDAYRQIDEKLGVYLC
ncbi:MAG: dephospho-CoA kinase [Lachnospiraceae bacterium]|nr:dephospho-CoA kinase [Lachnospiraceae bacterium]